MPLQKAHSRDPGAVSGDRKKSVCARFFFFRILDFSLNAFLACTDFFPSPLTTPWASKDGLKIPVVPSIFQKNSLKVFFMLVCSLKDTLDIFMIVLCTLYFMRHTCKGHCNF